MNTHRSSRIGGLLTALLIVCPVGGLLSACSATPVAAAPDAEAAQVEPIPGSTRSQVILTEESAHRVGIETVAVASNAAGAQQIPLSAVLYDNEGHTWTYTNPEPLTFVPVELTIDAIAGDDATFHTGPAVGTSVVTVGGAERLGAEYGVPGE
jgi:hypothetical protein